MCKIMYCEITVKKRPTLNSYLRSNTLSLRELKHYLLIPILNMYGPEENRTPDLLIANEAF